MTYTVDKIIAILKSKNYILCDNDDKNYNLNIVGIRSNAGKENVFNDLICVFWKYNGVWTLRSFPATTDPGTYWLNHPENPLGTAIVKEGQYHALWKIGMHQGKYKALVQLSAVTVFRDSDKDSELDLESSNIETGIFGINCHRANENGKSVSVDKWSAGCQVLQNREIFNPENQSVKVFEFDYFMDLCEKAKENWGDHFSYTLINENDFI